MENQAINLPSKKNAWHPESKQAELWKQSWKKNQDGYDKKPNQRADSSYRVLRVYQHQRIVAKRRGEKANDRNRDETQRAVRAVLHLQRGKEQISL